jgi:hypothetical protein
VGGPGGWREGGRGVGRSSGQRIEPSNLCKPLKAAQAPWEAVVCCDKTNLEIFRVAAQSSAHCHAPAYIYLVRCRGAQLVAPRRRRLSVSPYSAGSSICMYCAIGCAPSTGCPQPPTPVRQHAQCQPYELKIDFHPCF